TQDLAERRGTVIVDEDVEPAEIRERLGDDTSAVDRLADVSGDSEDLAAGLVADGFRRGFQLLRTSRHQRDIGAIGREPAGNAIADAFARPADDRYLALQAHAACSSPNSRAALPRITLS